MVFDHMTLWCATAAQRQKDGHQHRNASGLPLEALRRRIQARAKTIRNKRRAMLFWRMNSSDATRLKTAVDLVPDAGVVTGWDCWSAIARERCAGAGCEYASGPVSAERPAERNQSHLPFFPRQTLLHNHFRDHVMPLIQNLTTRAVYNVALSTMGNPTGVRRQHSANEEGASISSRNNDRRRRPGVQLLGGIALLACKGNAFHRRGGPRDVRTHICRMTAREIFAHYRTQGAFAQATAQPGDILTWVNGER